MRVRRRAIRRGLAGALHLSTQGRLRRNLADFFGLFAIPFAIALLPWRAGYAAVRWIAARGIGFGPEAAAAWSVAAAHSGALDEREWKRRFRLLRWVERADTYLTLLRSERWWMKRVGIEGDLPRGSPCVMLTYHWGAGHWVWKIFRAHGIGAHFLARRPTLHDFGIARVAAWYARLRGWSLGRVGCLGPLYTGGSAERVLDSLARGESIVAMLDLPLRDGRASEPVLLLGHRVAFPSGVARLADTAGVPVVLFSCDFDRKTGHRTLRIEPIAEPRSVETVMERYAQHLDARLREAPEAWYMWHEAGHAFAPEAKRTEDQRCTPL